MSRKTDQLLRQAVLVLEVIVQNQRVAIAQGATMLERGKKGEKIMDQWLESQQTSATPAVEQPAPNSSVGIETPAGSKYIWSTSSQWSFLVNPDGRPTQSLQQDILGWFSSLPIAGREQVLLRVEVTEIPIGSTPTSRDTAQPFGSPSPSTGEPIPEGSGRAGDTLGPVATEAAEVGEKWNPGVEHCFFPHPRIAGLYCSLKPDHEGHHSTSRYWPSPSATEAGEEAGA